MNAALVLVAAGKGSRLGQATPKAFVTLRGRPLFTYALATLSQIESLTGTILVVPPEWCGAAERAVSECGPWRVPVEVVAGGAERQDSVAAGLQRVDAELVMIHDAARPFIGLETARQCLSQAAAYGGAIVALPAQDTLKLADDDGCIAATLDRSKVWLAQTPQAFRVELLRDAVRRGLASGARFTDDAAFVEAAGGRVRLVPGDASNRKITTPADLEWAEWRVAATVG